MRNITNYLRNTLTIAVFILAISATSALAATFTVTNTNDSGAGSLRDAITQANTNAQADTINFDPAVFNVARTITLTSGELTITSDNQNPGDGRLVTINGPGANLLTISGNNAEPDISYSGNPQDSTANANVTMNGMTLRDGNGAGQPAAGDSCIYAATVTLNSMVIRNNLASGTTTGGAIV